MDTTTDQHVLRPLFETFLTFEPHLFFLQFLQLWTAVLNGILGLFGIGELFVAF